MEYTEMISKPVARVQSRICKLCGREFSPIDSRGAKSSRLYCRRPECEKERERLYRERMKVLRKRKENVVKE